MLRRLFLGKGGIDAFLWMNRGRGVLSGLAHEEATDAWRGPAGEGRRRLELTDVGAQHLLNGSMI